MNDVMLNAFHDELEKLAANRLEKGLLAALVATTMGGAGTLAKSQARSQSTRPAIVQTVKKTKLPTVKTPRRAPGTESTPYRGKFRDKHGIPSPRERALEKADFERRMKAFDAARKAERK